MINKDEWVLTSDNTSFSLHSWQQTVDLLAEIFDAPASFLVQHTSGGYQATVASNQKTNPYPAGVIIPPDANIFCRRIVESGQLLYVPNALTEREWDTNPEVHEDGFVSYLGVPVSWPDGSAFGTFCVMDYRETNYTDAYVRLIHQLRDILESDLKLIHAYDKIKNMALTDELTHLYNRRGFLELTEQNILLARRSQYNLGLMYFDVDDFKIVNDSHGHQTGDKILHTVAKCLKCSIRGSDIAGRLGGDEFAATVSIAHEADMQKIAQRFLAKLDQSLKDDKLPVITVSVGCTAIDKSQLDLESIIHDADQDMYQQKKHKKSQH